MSGEAKSPSSDEKGRSPVVNKQASSRIKPFGYIWYAIWGIVFLPLTLGELILWAEDWFATKVSDKPRLIFCVKCIAFPFQWLFWPEKLMTQFRQYPSVGLFIRIINITCWTIMVIFIPSMGSGLSEMLEVLFSTVINMENISISTFSIVFVVCYVGARQLFRALGEDCFTEKSVQSDVSNPSAGSSPGSGSGKKTHPPTRSHSVADIKAPVPYRQAVSRPSSDACLGRRGKEEDRGEIVRVPRGRSFEQFPLVISTSQDDLRDNASAWGDLTPRGGKGKSEEDNDQIDRNGSQNVMY